MNNDPSPTSPADPFFHPNQRHAPDIDIQRSSHSSSASESQQNDSAADPENPSLSQSAKEGLSKKLQFLVHLSLNLDAVVIAELCTLYYMEYVFSPSLVFVVFTRRTCQVLPS
jgi:hypothetical protein